MRSFIWLNLWGGESVNEGLQAKKTKKKVTLRVIQAAQQEERERCERKARSEHAKRRRMAEEPAIPRMEDMMSEFQIETR